MTDKNYAPLDLKGTMAANIVHFARALRAEIGIRCRRYGMAAHDIGKFGGHRHQVIGHVGVQHLTLIVIEAFFP